MFQKGAKLKIHLHCFESYNGREGGREGEKGREGELGGVMRGKEVSDERNPKGREGKRKEREIKEKIKRKITGRVGLTVAQRKKDIKGSKKFSLIWGWKN